jgi:hypothetical protein
VAGLLAAHPQLDIERMRREVSAFAAAVAMSDVIEDVEKLLRAARPAPGDIQENA